MTPPSPEDGEGQKTQPRGGEKHAQYQDGKHPQTHKERPRAKQRRETHFQTAAAVTDGHRGRAPDLMKGSVYAMIGRPAPHMLLERESNHQSSSITRPSGHSQFRPPATTVLHPCPAPSVPPSPAAGSCLCFSRSTGLLLYRLLSRCSLKKSQSGGGRPRRRNQLGVGEEIDSVLNEAAVLLSRGVAAPLVIIGPL